MKYVIKFKKTGVICYTSHLDIMKVFKRAFKRAGIKLAYSQGFNPHPKMGFAQPLSLGYKGYDEYMEFETAQEHAEGEGERMLAVLRKIMPEGLTLVSISEAPELKKSLASLTEACDYEIKITLQNQKQPDPKKMWSAYMNQEFIMALKKQKKKQNPVLVNIKPKIRKIAFALSGNQLTVSCRLDAGSNSNLSPELVIDTVLDTFDIEADRSRTEVKRLKIHFKE